MRDPGHLAWFKQDTGRAPLCILSTYSNVNGSTIHNGFSINRFKIQKSSSSFNLSILHVEFSDAGLYFCGMIPITHMEFGNATLLQFEVLGVAPGGAVSQPSLSLTVKPGDTVTLQCCVLMRDPGHLAWFKQDTGRAPLCILSTYSNVNGSTIHNGFSINRFKIQKSSSSFNLSILHVEFSDAGLYFCGMIPITHMEFGNATLLQFEGKQIIIKIYLTDDFIQRI
ncbi:KVX01 protein, partial [Atractosteus spatula]|nr:KVX01 protein [Atractosteus spatula]